MSATDDIAKNWQRLQDKTSDAEIRDGWRDLAHRLRDQRDGLRQLLRWVRHDLPPDSGYHDMIERALEATKQQ